MERGSVNLKTSGSNVEKRELLGSATSNPWPTLFKRRCRRHESGDKPTPSTISLPINADPKLPIEARYVRVTMADTLPFSFDQVGIWSELKLEIVEKYGSAYTGAFANERRLKKFYVDAFSGAGVHISKRSGGQIEGSPARALKTSPPFDGFVFIDMDAQKTAHLKTLCADRNDVHIETGDASKYLIHTLLPTIRYEDYKRALCLFDPYGLTWNGLRWRWRESLAPSICS
jgi:hypothetical protein